MLALADESGVIVQLALFSDTTAFRRNEGDWLPITDEDAEEFFDGLVAIDAKMPFVSLFDMAEDTDATLHEHDVV